MYIYIVPTNIYIYIIYISCPLFSDGLMVFQKSPQKSHAAVHPSTSPRARCTARLKWWKWWKTIGKLQELYGYIIKIYDIYDICVFLNGFQGTNRRIAIFWLGQILMGNSNPRTWEIFTVHPYFMIETYWFPQPCLIVKSRSFRWLSQSIFQHIQSIRCW
jgi:hypothetical protein